MVDRKINTRDIATTTFDEYLPLFTKGFLAILEKAKSPDSNPHLLIQEYFESVFIYALMMEANYTQHKNELYALRNTLGELAETLPHKAFGHILETKRENDFFGFFVDGLVHYGLPRKPAIEHVSLWMTNAGYKASIVKVRKAHELYRKECISSNFWTISKYFDDIKAHRIMFPNFSMHKQTAMKIFSTEEIFAFSHPKAKTALTKFKQLLLDIG